MNVQRIHARTGAALAALGFLLLAGAPAWADKNDTFYLESYKRAKGLKSLVALCFTVTGETFHHWNVFSPGPAGVCVEFEKEAFLAMCTAVSDLRHDYVEYRQLNELDRESPEQEDFPFLKRYPYRHEVEYRLIHEDLASEHDSWSFSLDVATINRIHLSPWLPKALRKSMVDTLRTFPGCADLTIYRTTVLENPRWKSHAKLLDAVEEAPKLGPPAIP